MIDLDGTLLDTALDLTEAANAMLREFGRPECDVETVRTFIGRGLHNLVQRCLAGEICEVENSVPSEEAFLSFRRHYRESNGRHAAVYPGVVEGLRAMQEKGLRLACVTNKATDFTLPLLELSGLSDWFELVICGDTLAKAKPDPMQLFHICRQFEIEPGEALLIGDSLNDVQAARAAGCPVFCVPYGYNQGVAVRETDCDVIVASLEAAAGLVIVK